MREPFAEKPKDVMKTLSVKGNWNIVKGKLKQKLARLTEDDLQFAEGKEEELLGRIQQRAVEKITGTVPALQPCTAGHCQTK